MANKGKKKKELMEALNVMGAIIEDFLEDASVEMEERDYEKVAVRSLEVFEELFAIIERQFWKDIDN